MAAPSLVFDVDFDADVSALISEPAPSSSAIGMCSRARAGHDPTGHPRRKLALRHHLVMSRPHVAISLTKLALRHLMAMRERQFASTDVGAAP